MIVPMKKVMVAMLASERGKGLKALRSLGMVHPEPLSGSGERYEGLKRDRELLERAVGLLSAMKTPSSLKPAPELGPIEAARRLEALQEREKEIQARRAELLKERDRLSELADFDPISLRSLGVPGKTARLHALPPGKGGHAFPEGVDAVLLGMWKVKVYYLSLAPDAMADADLPESFALPEKGRDAMGAELAELRQELLNIEDERAALTLALPGVKKALSRVASEERLETLASGMAKEGPVAYLSGWAPAEAVDELADEAARRGWAFLDEEPSAEDQPPTMVRNSPMVRIVQPVFDFLGTVPGYREYEISAWFLVFFTVFFAMIFGDGGYGLLMLSGAGALALASKAKGKPIPDGIWLFLLLAVFTVAWGILTGSWFAIPGASLPSWLRSLAVPAITGWDTSNPALENPAAGDNIKILCFILGLVQLSLAHLKNIVRDLKAGSPKFLGQLGSLALVTGMFWLVLNLVIDPARFPIPNFSLYLVGGGFALVFAFSNYERNILQSVLDGLKNIIPTFLGTVSVFADIVSYIRLWAVGLAGVAISQTVNGMAGGMMGGFWLMAIVGSIILAFGHGLNLVMSVLSVIVHGIRLNMLEFSGHLGMEWSGYKYDPLSQPSGGEDEGKELT